MLEERDASHAVADAASGVEPARHGGGRERPERVSGSNETKTYGKDAEVREHEENGYYYPTPASVKLAAHLSG
jgi:hypothetical protein